MWGRGGPRGWAHGSFSLSVNIEPSSWVQPQQGHHLGIPSEPRLTLGAPPPTSGSSSFALVYFRAGVRVEDNGVNRITETTPPSPTQTYLPNEVRKLWTKTMIIYQKSHRNLVTETMATRVC